MTMNLFSKEKIFSIGGSGSSLERSSSHNKHLLTRSRSSRKLPVATRSQRRKSLDLCRPPKVEEKNVPGPRRQSLDFFLPKFEQNVTTAPCTPASSVCEGSTVTLESETFGATRSRELNTSQHSIPGPQKKPVEGVKTNATLVNKRQEMFRMGGALYEEQNTSCKHLIGSPRKKPDTKRRKQLGREMSLPRMEKIEITEAVQSSTTNTVEKSAPTSKTIVLEPGLVLIQNFFSDERCQDLYQQALQWAQDQGEDGFYSTSQDGKRVLNTGEKGRGRIYDNINRFDPSLKQDCQSIVDAAVASDPDMPQMDCTHVLINMYTNSEGLVWHRDIYENDGQKDHPIVMQAVGSSCRFGYKHRDEDPIKEVIVRSGDALLFGGPCRMVQHSILEVMLDDCPAWMKESPFRLSFTYRDSPNVIGREHEFKYFKIDEHLVGQDTFDLEDKNARLGAMETQKAQQVRANKELVLEAIRALTSF